MSLDEAPRRPEGTVLALIQPLGAPERVVGAASELARALGKPWTALFVETPDTARSGGSRQVADALSLAARLDGSVASVPATSEAEGLAAFRAHASLSHVVLSAGGGRFAGLVAAVPDALFVVVPGARSRPGRPGLGDLSSRGALPRDFAVAAAAVLVTLPAVLLLKSVIGRDALSLLFLFPVLGVAARLGFLPALMSALLSVLCFNFFLLRPVYALRLTAPQNAIVALVLVGLAAYVSLLTQRLRDRVALSDRSAHENASLAAFGLSLASAGDWESTGEIVCREIAELLGIRAALFREVEGSLVLFAAYPQAPVFGPLDAAALDLSWREQVETGAGTAAVAAADWQFQPLKTSLGLLAILALAAEDAGEPVQRHKKMLLSTMITQAALAHERLRLEDLAFRQRSQ